MKSTEEATLPTDYGNFKVRAFRTGDGREHLAVYKGDLSSDKVPVRIHSQCVTGDIFHSMKCDCRRQLEKSLKYVADGGLGVVVYLAQEGRGIGLFNKINAYRLQETGFDTVEANHQLGFPTDMRDYRDAADILKALGVESVALLTNNKAKIKGLEESGLKVVERIPLAVEPNPHNRRYLKTKREKMNHLL
jgi:3,4-dihydroxy 2-butanone 4-phosphate synthase/GTP cyclohydrolase II